MNLNNYIKKSLIDFIKIWKKVENRVTTIEQDLKDTFAVALLLIFKLEVLDHDDISLGKMIDKFIKKEPYILQNYKELQNKQYKGKKLYISNTSGSNGKH